MCKRLLRLWVFVCVCVSLIVIHKINDKMIKLWMEIDLAPLTLFAVIIISIYPAFVALQNSKRHSICIVIPPFFRTFGTALTTLKLTLNSERKHCSIFHQISIWYGYLIFDLRVLFMHLKIYANDFLWISNDASSNVYTKRVHYSTEMHKPSTHPFGVDPTDSTLPILHYCCWAQHKLKSN